MDAWGANEIENILSRRLDLILICRNNLPHLSGEGPHDSVLAFVDRHIESVEQLEILLLLADSERHWSAVEIFHKIQSSQSSVEQRLAALVTAGVVGQDEKKLFYFAPKNDETRSLIGELAAAYKMRRVRIIEAIYTRKTDAVKTFADAFKFRRD